jgi:NAD-dependent DNA ligase
MSIVENLVKQLTQYNEAYRLGDPLVSDAEYDVLVEQLEELDPTNSFFDNVGIKVADKERERKLPIAMASMNKIKSMEEVQDWCRLKGISTDIDVVLTPKYDGLSLCVDEAKDKATTRGDGKVGQASDEHYKFITNHLTKEVGEIHTNVFDYTYGEVMMSRETFKTKYSMNFANPRNLVAGLINNKSATEPLKDTEFIKYGGIVNENAAHIFNLKSDILNELNRLQSIQVPFKIMKISDLTEELLVETFKEWSTNYEIDGIIVEVNNLSIQEKLGRERSTNNPVWARAFKSPQFEQSAITTVIGISWNISKQGYLKPILHIEPVRLDGVTVSNVTGNNARFVKDMGLGIGAKIRVVRSGMVIPLVKEVIEPVEFVMPDIDNIGWNENEVELITLTETKEQKFKQLVSFFEILEVENAGEGVFAQLWDAGYQTVKEILELKPVNMEKLEGFGKRKAEIVYNAIQSRVNNIELSKLQHATGIFKMLGSKKLALLEGFKTKPTLAEVMAIEGFAEKSAQSYLDGYDKFNEFVKGLPITISEKKAIEKSSNELEGRIFVFTGVRDKNAEITIESKGGKIGSGVSSKTTDLIMKTKGSGSSKENKAIELGINILTLDELLDLLK